MSKGKSSTYKQCAGLPGRWRARAIRYGSYALEVELPCINGLSAWFSVATFHETDEAERMMTDGAKLEAGEYAQRFSEIAAVVAEPVPLPSLEEALQVITGFLQCPEIADCHPEDKDPETSKSVREERA